MPTSNVAGARLPVESAAWYPYLPPALISPTVRQALHSGPVGSRQSPANALVVPLPALDQALSPSSLVARTCTW